MEVFCLVTFSRHLIMVKAKPQNDGQIGGKMVKLKTKKNGRRTKEKRMEE